MSYPPHQGWQQPPSTPQQPPAQWPQQQAYQGAPPYGQPYGQQYAPPPPPMPPSGPQPGMQAPPMPQAMPQPGQLQCRICGCMPAAQVKFRGHQGILIVMRFLSLQGPFCHDCGMSTYRRMTANTLIQGWWGYASSVITPITVLINLTRRGKVANLPAPVPPPDGNHGRPLDPGKPLYARPQTWIGPLLPFLVIFAFILLATLSHS